MATVAMKSLKVYVAARFYAKDEVLHIYQSLWVKGHTIIADWTKHKNVKPYSEHPGEASLYAEEDLRGAMDCDVFILLTSERAGGGVSAELGAALAANRLRNGAPKIYVVGQHLDPNAFYFHPAVERRNTIAQVLAEL
jgi:hypothetical protein